MRYDRAEVLKGMEILGRLTAREAASSDEGGEGREDAVEKGCEDTEKKEIINLSAVLGALIQNHVSDNTALDQEHVREKSPLDALNEDADNHMEHHDSNRTTPSARIVPTHVLATACVRALRRSFISKASQSLSLVIRLWWARSDAASRLKACMYSIKGRNASFLVQNVEMINMKTRVVETRCIAVQGLTSVPPAINKVDVIHSDNEMGVSAAKTCSYDDEYNEVGLETSLLTDNYIIDGPDQQIYNSDSPRVSELIQRSNACTVRSPSFSQDAYDV